MSTDQTSKKVAGRMKTIRLQKGLTQSEVAKKATINTNTYAKIERGEQAATVAMLQRIADALEVDLYKVFKFKSS